MRRCRIPLGARSSLSASRPQLVDMENGQIDREDKWADRRVGEIGQDGNIEGYPLLYARPPYFPYTTPPLFPVSYLPIFAISPILELYRPDFAIRYLVSYPISPVVVLYPPYFPISYLPTYSMSFLLPIYQPYCPYTIWLSTLPPILSVYLPSALLGLFLLDLPRRRGAA